MNIRIDASGLKRRMADVRRGSDAAQQEAVSALASIVAVHATRLTRAMNKVDTGRYVRGWETANNSLPVGRRVPVTLLKQSRYFFRNKKTVSMRFNTLEARRLKLKAEVDEMSTWRGLDSNEYYKMRVSSLKRITKAVDKLRAYIDILNSGEGGTTVLIGARRGILIPQLVSKVYGGDSRVYKMFGKWFAAIRNLEAHASLVERGFIKRVKSDSGDAVETKATGSRILALAIAHTRSLGSVSLGDLQSRFQKSLVRSQRSGRY